MRKIVSLAVVESAMSPAQQQGYFSKLDCARVQIWTPVSRYVDFVHYIWMGQSFDVHLSTYEDATSFREKFPDKEILLWTDSVSASNRAVRKWARDHQVRLILIDAVFNSNRPMINQDLFDHELEIVETNFAKRADILRYEIEYRFAGIYMDVVDVHPSSISCLDRKSPSKALPLFCVAREFGFSSSSLAAYFEQSGDSIPKGFEAVDFGINNDILSANRPLIPFYKTILDAIHTRSLLSYDALKSMQKVRRDTPLSIRCRPFEFRYVFWHTMVCTGPTLLKDVLKLNPLKPSWKISKNTVATAATWLRPLEDRFTEWTPASDHDSDAMVDRVIASSLDRLCRHRFDVTRYQFLLDKCLSTANYPNPSRDLLHILLNALNQCHGRYQIKFVFASDPLLYRQIWDVIERTENRGFPKPDPDALVAGPTTPNLFKALKRAIKTKNVALMHYFMELWTQDMWLIRRERNGCETPPEFTRAFRLLRAASRTGDASLFWEVAQFVSGSMYTDSELIRQFAAAPSLRI